jgi:hypothetical protein
MNFDPITFKIRMKDNKILVFIHHLCPGLNLKFRPICAAKGSLQMIVPRGGEPAYSRDESSAGVKVAGERGQRAETNPKKRNCPHFDHEIMTPQFHFLYCFAVERQQEIRGLYLVKNELTGADRRKVCFRSIHEKPIHHCRPAKPFFNFCVHKAIKINP